MTQDDTIPVPVRYWPSGDKRPCHLAPDICESKKCEIGTHIRSDQDQLCRQCPDSDPGSKVFVSRTFFRLLRRTWSIESQGRGWSWVTVLITLIGPYLTQPQPITSNKTKVFGEILIPQSEHIGLVFLSPLEILRLIIWEVVGDSNLPNALLGVKNCI